MTKRAFGIFAYNEEKDIIHSISRILEECSADIYVLINGCRDNTQSVVEEFAKDHPSVKPIVIDVGDKANAWNVFIHDLGIDADFYYLADGDCEIVKGGVEKIESYPDVEKFNCIAATPVGSTINRVKLIEDMLINGGVAGAFYGLTRQFVDRLRESSVRFPVGVIGDDGLIAALAYWDLKPFSDWNLKNILVLKDVNYDYRQLSLLNLSDLQLYYRRKVRYSMRSFQNKMITESFKSKGLSWMNGHVRALYIEYPELLKLKWNGLDTYFDWRALKAIKRDLEKIEK